MPAEVMSRLLCVCAEPLWTCWPPSASSRPQPSRFLHSRRCALNRIKHHKQLPCREWPRGVGAGRHSPAATNYYRWGGRQGFTIPESALDTGGNRSRLAMTVSYLLSWCCTALALCRGWVDLCHCTKMLFITSNLCTASAMKHTLLIFSAFSSSSLILYIVYITSLLSYSSPGVAGQPVQAGWTVAADHCLS